ncbi:LPXTG cell wall anchor domain-containing protein [Methylomonas koyamae]|uniref:LPXTG cell wall anchor domain-containing protein n=1 Tax=Methylomonas koyamae TaxID=702114 RepID=UPI0028737287|nr:LPXTG cell wall anchor domain-containing protein [Methylomonas koyamae]WNB76213.1 LPXTG cell wall anchor domain-containing protein [Methylomonas koyamae]
MTNLRFPAFWLSALLAAVLLSGCDKLGFGAKQSNALGNRPDLDCIIANDFYAVHFSAYLQPDKNDKTVDAKAAFVPFCQQIPRAGKMFFTADLIDRDIRTTPIGIRLVEVEKTGQKAPDDIREIRTVTEIPAKLYPKGAVEAQADVDKTGDYVLYLLIGDAIEEDDKFRVALQVGVAPGGSQTPWLAIGGVTAAITLVAAFLIFLIRRKRKAAAEQE